MAGEALRALVFGIRRILQDGIEKTFSPTLNFIGATVQYNANDKRLDVTVTGSGAALGSSLPQPLGDPAVGASALGSHQDHVHAHGNQGGGSDHELADGSQHGFMSKTDFSKLAAIDENILNAQRAWKPPARTIALDNIPDLELASAGDFEVSPESGDRVLLTRQTNQEENIVYVVTIPDPELFTMTPATDFDSDADLVVGMTIQVLEGASKGLWRLSSPTTGTIQAGVDALEWAPVDGAELVDFTELQLFERNTKTVHDGDGSAPLSLGIDALATPVLDATLEVYIPAGALEDSGDGTAVRTGVAPQFRPAQWDAIDVAKAYYVFARVVGVSPLELSCAAFVLETSVAAPTVVSLEIDASDADKLTAVFSGPVRLKDLLGLSLTGTALTLTSIVSGNGTDTVVFDLSGDADGDGTIQLVIGGTRTLQSIGGVLIATGTHDVDQTGFAYVMPGEIRLYKGDDVVLSGSDVTTINDQIGSENLACTGTPQIVTISGKPAIHFDAGEYAHADFAAQVDLDNFAFLLVCRLNSDDGNYQTLFSTGVHGALTTSEHQMIIYDGATGGIGRRKNGATGDVTMSGGIDTSVHALLFTGDAAGAVVYRDSDTPNGSSAVTADADDVRRFVLARMADLSTTQDTFDVDVLEWRIGTQKLTGTDVTDLFDYVQTEYGV